MGHISHMGSVALLGILIQPQKGFVRLKSPTENLNTDQVLGGMKHLFKAGGRE